MKRAVFLLSLGASCLAYGQEFVLTSYGDLAVTSDGEQHKLTLGGKPLSLPGSDGYGILGFEVETPYKTSSGEVFLLTETSGASCQYYRFVTLGKKEPTVTPAFGTCDDGPKVTQKGDKITLRMKNSDSKTETYVYHKGIVTLNGKPVE